MTPLHRLGDLLRDALLRVPLPAARGLFVASFLVILVWMLRLPRVETTDPATGGAGRNLKPWAAIALIAQLAIYFMF